MEIGNFSLGNSEIGNCSYENPHVSFSNGDELSFCFYGIDQAAFLFTFIKKGDRKTWYQIDFKIVIKVRIIKFTNLLQIILRLWYWNERIIHWYQHANYQETW